MESLTVVQDYYGKVLKSTQDLKTNACCTAESMPVHLRSLLKEIHQEVKDRFYGCGSPIPYALEGKTVLDLGSGTGRDCFMLAKLVGPEGSVIGVDMTEEQIAVAEKYVGYHTKKFGYAQANVKFVRGYIEDLKSAGIADASIDVVISNCVINLSPDKERVFAEIFRVLKPAGELYFSDVFSGRRIPKELRMDPVFLGECLGGALYREDFRRLLSRLGCHDYRLTSSSPITLHNTELAERAGLIDFYSLTVRAFKLDLEDRCENFGQIAIYKGGIPESPHAFVLDDHHIFEKGKPEAVCGNTAAMLSKSRYGQYFGLFACAPTPSLTNNTQAVGSCC